MKTQKRQQKTKKSESDTESLSPSGASENGKIYGFRFQPKFSESIDVAAKRMGMRRSDFVRAAIAKAVETAGVSVGENFNVCRQGKQSLPKSEVLARAAGARAVRDSKTPGTPENARKMELLAAGYGEEAIAAYLYAKARAEKTVGRALTPDEDEEFITSAAKAVAKANESWGAGPPNLNAQTK